ncbi:hypothetical protein GCM10022402_10300 [Salinactinospora qingdaonensis]|uniref:Uncharacterized protein n=1 Tax=Salinactinospora qingdaonensis TaxID=702744 RepID=A0ABP7F4U4_9ACTN
MAERPARETEFEALFAAALRTVTRPEPTRLHLVLANAYRDTARELAGRERECCSFFVFSFASHDDGLHLDVTVPARHTPILDELAGRAASALAKG